MAGEQVIDVVDSAVKTVNVVNPLLRKLWVSLLILLLGLIVGKILGKLVKRVMHELEADKALKSATGRKSSIEKLASNFVTYFTYFIAVIMALDTIGVTSAVLNMIAGIVILTILISVLLAIKDFVPNAAAGMMLRSKNQYKKGAKIKIKNIEGTISEIGLLETKIITKNKDTIIIPNAMFTKHETIVKN